MSATGASFNRGSSNQDYETPPDWMARCAATAWALLGTHAGSGNNMAELTFTVPGCPVPKARPRLGKGGHTFTPGKTVEYESAVRAYAARAIGRSTWIRLGTFEVEIVFYVPDNIHRDLDNLAKSVLDALNTIAWMDDSQVTDLILHKRVDKAKPRARIAIATGSKAPYGDD